MDENNPEVRSHIDYLYKAVMDDTDALEDAKMTLEIIKKTDPGVYDEMIDDALASIRAALSSSILGTIEKLQRKEWQGLTDEERISCLDRLTFKESLFAVEAKLREKNCG
jgi:hypothetical protein